MRRTAFPHHSKPQAPPDPQLTPTGPPTPIMMQPRSSMPWRRPVALLLLAVLCPAWSGCAAVFRGTTQKVDVRASTEGGFVWHEGRKVHGGDVIVIQKKAQQEYFKIGEEERGAKKVPMTYSLDPIIFFNIIGFFVFFVPGVVGFAVDFGTGAWREYHSPQMLTGQLPVDRPPRTAPDLAPDAPPSDPAASAPDPSASPAPGGEPPPDSATTPDPGTPQIPPGTRTSPIAP